MKSNAMHSEENTNTTVHALLKGFHLPFLILHKAVIQPFRTEQSATMSVKEGPAGWNIKGIISYKTGQRNV